MREQAGAFEQTRRSKYIARATKWGEAALAHTRTIDLVGIDAESEAVLLKLEEAMPNVEVVRIARSIGFETRAQPIPVPGSPHLIMSADCWDSDQYRPLTVPVNVRSVTMFINIPRRRSGENGITSDERRRRDRRSCFDSFLLRHVQNITVVFRPVDPPLEIGSSGTLCALDWRCGLETLVIGGRYTFVNVTEETYPAIATSSDEQDIVDGDYEAAFMRQLERSADLEYRLQYLRRQMTEGPAEVVRRGVRVLGMEAWMAEASKDDQEACRSFW
jgi:hypothetical protein